MRVEVVINIDLTFNLILTFNALTTTVLHHRVCIGISRIVRGFFFYRFSPIRMARMLRYLGERQLVRMQFWHHNI